MEIVSKISFLSFSNLDVYYRKKAYLKIFYYLLDSAYREKIICEIVLKTIIKFLLYI